MNGLIDDLTGILSEMGFALFGDESEVSDGYHTFEELYAQRSVLYLSLVESLLNNKEDFIVLKSKTHQDGSSEEGWFLLLLINGRTGEQVSFHLNTVEYWNLAPGEDMTDKYTEMPAFDGHSSEDVLNRLRKWFLNTYDKVVIDYGESTEDPNISTH